MGSRAEPTNADPTDRLHTHTQREGERAGPMQPAAHSHGASLSESRVPAQLITIVVPGRAVANAMMQRLDLY